MRLKKNRPFIQRAEEGGVNDDVDRRVEMVAFIAGGIFAWMP